MAPAPPRLRNARALPRPGPRPGTPARPRTAGLKAPLVALALTLALPLSPGLAAARPDPAPAPPAAPVLPGASTAPALLEAPVLPGAPAVPAPAAPDCGAVAGVGFPLVSRLHGGPAAYPAGGPLQDWKLDLTNTTAAPCAGIHPVLVLTDRRRALRPEHIRFEFHDARADRWHPVAFEVTEEAENVGAFSGFPGFQGFTVPPGRTLTVPVRLAFRADTAPDEVVVNAAVVQRRGADGDWVGQSGDYRLAIGPARSPSAPPADPGRTPAPPTGTAPGEPAPSVPPAPSSTVSPVPSGSPPAGDGHDPSQELALTGREYGLLLAPLAGVLALAGAFLVRGARRRRRP
ncbi:hypothetical protein [Streptomyces sp.]|uniref:hypothetical protein n=1 Tax=Streptomyces sp. TaxID=1931 RepID=UPI0028110F9C|nr:hypothetical protein [Streptomyces sp.]